MKYHVWIMWRVGCWLNRLAVVDLGKRKPELWKRVCWRLAYYLQRG